MKTKKVKFFDDSGLSGHPIERQGYLFYYRGIALVVGKKEKFWRLYDYKTGWVLSSVNKQYKTKDVALNDFEDVINEIEVLFNGKFEDLMAVKYKEVNLINKL